MGVMNHQYSAMNIYIWARSKGAHFTISGIHCKLLLLLTNPTFHTPRCPLPRRQMMITRTTSRRRVSYRSLWAYSAHPKRRPILTLLRRSRLLLRGRPVQRLLVKHRSFCRRLPTPLPRVQSMLLERTLFLPPVHCVHHLQCLKPCEGRGLLHLRALG